jgi:hypothetical protein
VDAALTAGVLSGDLAPSGARAHSTEEVGTAIATRIAAGEALHV